MRTKRVLSLLLTCAVLCGMLVLPTAADTASTASTTFTDIADPEVAGPLRPCGSWVSSTVPAAPPLRRSAPSPGRNSARWQWSSWATATRCRPDEPHHLQGRPGHPLGQGLYRRGHPEHHQRLRGERLHHFRASSGETPTAISIRTGPSPMRRPSPFWCASWAMGTAMWEWCGPAAIWPRPMSWRSPTG